jgi:hypothetical protein
MPPKCVEANGVLVSQGVGPMHGSCAMFSSLACPWVSSRPSAGETPVLTAFAGYGVVIGDRAEPPALPLRFGYFDPVERVPHADLRRRYEQSLADEPDTTRPRLWWDDDAEGQRRLARCAAEDAGALLAMHDTAPAFPSVARIWTSAAGASSSGHIDLTTDPRLQAAARQVLAAALAARCLGRQDRAAAAMAAAEAARRSCTTSQLGS